MTFLNRNNVTLFVHIFCWLIFAFGVLYYHPSTWDTPVPTTFWIKQIILLAILSSVFYLNFYVLIPKLLIRKKVSVYIAFVVVLLALVYLLNALIKSSLNLTDLIFAHQDHEFLRTDRHRGRFDTFVPGITLLMIGLGVTVSFIQKWQQELNLRQQLEQEKVTTELTLLKAQINPHFFFNTLNNIYSYTLSDGNLARTAIMNLSKMMRYVLYDSSNGQTSLSKEVAFIRDYIELMRLRVSPKTKISFIVANNLRDYKIAPMLFLPFVENAFKHGISSIAEGYIIVSITQNPTGIELIVTNTVYESKRANEEKSNGIGLSNTARRLELLYPGKNNLNTGMISETEYQAKLTFFL
jgi:two-component system LytT family sensor kinase